MVQKTADIPTIHQQECILTIKSNWVWLIYFKLFFLTSTVELGVYFALEHVVTALKIALLFIFCVNFFIFCK